MEREGESAETKRSAHAQTKEEPHKGDGELAGPRFIHRLVAAAKAML